MTAEEVELKLNQWISGYRGRVMLVECAEEKGGAEKMTWEEFFINLPHLKTGGGMFIIVKHETGPLIIWGRK